jgi:peptidoglycan/xylan/chitin deacetylase (PgdA/CDA1 family)
MIEGNPYKIKVLMYHRIVSTESLSYSYPQLCTHTNEFRNHLSLLERLGFTAITFKDYRLFQEGALSLPKKPVIITFDDGYVDTYENAFPLLREFGMNAVVFILGDRQIKENIWDKSSGLPLAPLVDEQQILEMHDGGWEIGSHSMTHAKLPSLPRDQAWDEISRSRMLLEILLNSPVKTFAFPYGLVDNTTKKMVSDAGYTIGCATYSGPPAFDEDSFEIRRIFLPGGMDTIQFSLRLLTPYEYYAWIKWKIKHLIFSRKSSPQHKEQTKQTGIIKQRETREEF